MKKIFTLLITSALFVLLLVSCADGGVTHNSLPSSASESMDITSDTQGSQPPDTQPPDDEPDTQDEPASATVSHFITGQDFYPQLDCGSYYGKDFHGETSALYRIIDTYEELSVLTSKGVNFPESIFDGYVVLALYRFEGTEDIGRIGYTDFKMTDGKASITLHAWSADYIDESPAEWSEVTYLQLPKIDVAENGNTVGGKITINRDEISLYDMAQVETRVTEYNLGTAWLLEPLELQGFLEKNGIERLNWKRYSDYLNREYKILVFYIETDRPDIIGYGDLTVNGNEISINREYKDDSRFGKRAVLEFVAIPSNELNISFDENTQCSIAHVRNGTELLTSDIKINETVFIEEENYEYYELLDLGVYYYFDELPEGDAYHVIKSYEELKRYVEKPDSLSLDDFNDSVVIVLKIKKYNPYRAFGIRNLYYKDRSMLYATLDFGRYHVESDENEQEKIDEFEAETQQKSFYYYLLAPKSEHDSVYREKKGSLYLTVNNLENRSEYYVYDYVPNENYQLKLNSSWILTSYSDFTDFLKETGVELYSHFSYALERENKFVFVYYGALPWHTKFGDFLSNNKNAYIDVSYYDNKDTYEPRIFAMEISKDLLHCTGESITLHMTEYRQLEAKRREGVDRIYKELEGFNVNIEVNTLTQAPDFEWKYITDYTELQLVLAEYTSLTKAPIEIDFNELAVIAYFANHGCTGCPEANTFSNVRVVNNIMFIDNYVENHGGGEMITPTIHFILVDKIDSNTFNRVVFLQKNSYAYEEIENIKNIRSEYTTHIISTISINAGADLKKKPEFGYKFIESLEDLQAIYEEYTNVEMLTNFKALDFESMCILAYYYQEGSNITVYGGFKDMRVENNRLYIEKYFPQYDGKNEILGDCAECPTLHLIAIEKTFNPEDIIDVIVTKEPWSQNIDIIIPDRAEDKLE